MDLGDLKYLDAPAKVLKLSTAMRIGSAMRPQVRRFFFSGTGSCALGAAYEGATGQGDVCFMEDIISVFPELWRMDLREEIAERNDAGQSRESIADWLESQGY